MHTRPKFSLLLLCLALLTCACGKSARDRQAMRQIEKTWPQAASPIVWPENMKPADHLALDSFLAQSLSALAGIRAEHLAVKDQARFQKLLRRLEDEQKMIRMQAENPAIYNLPGHWKALLAQSSARPDDKILMLQEQLPLVASYYSAAKAKLSRPSPELLDLAIRKHILGMEFLDGELQEFIEAHAQGENKRALLLQLLGAKIAVKQYLAWCNSARLNNSPTLPAE